jgi:hypothetical protein
MSGEAPAGPMSGAGGGGASEQQADVLGSTDGEATGGHSNLVADLAKGGDASGGGTRGGLTVAGRTVTMSGAGVLLLVLVAAGAVLFGMRHLGMNGSLHFERIDLDYDLEQQKHNAGSLDHERLLGDLRASVDVVQVPLSDVQMNPFLWKELLKPPQTEEVEKDQAPQVDPAVLELQRKRAAIEDALNAMRLSSVFGGSSPMALINGESRSVGDQLAGGLFVIVHIDGPGTEHGPRVILEVPREHRADHKHYVVHMQ